MPAMLTKYVQPWKGGHRVRMPVPKAVQKQFIGKKDPLFVGNKGPKKYLHHTLRTTSKDEANRLSRQVIAEFDKAFRLVLAGEWPPVPPVSEEAVEVIGAALFPMWAQENAKTIGWNEHAEDLDDFLVTGDNLNRAVTAYLSAEGMRVKPGGESFRRIVSECRFNLSPLIHSSHPEPSRHVLAPVAQSANASTYTFRQLVEGWTRERKPAASTRRAMDRHVNRFIKHLGHDNASTVIKANIQAWKEDLIADEHEGRIKPKSVYNALYDVKTLFNWAQENDKVETNPGIGVSYEAKTDAKEKRLPFHDQDAKSILRATRKTSGYKRWMPWLTAYTGARLEEIAGAMASDVKRIDGIWCIRVSEESRALDGATLKNEGSERNVPLHPAVIAEGFLKYASKLPEDGPLFPDAKPDRDGRRSGTATKQIGRWMREKVGISDPRKAPSHSWRHYFKTICRRAGLPEEIHDALTGHANGSTGRDYGEYDVLTLARWMRRIQIQV